MTTYPQLTFDAPRNVSLSTSDKNEECTLIVILLICAILPIPKDASTVKIQNKTASSFPNILQCFLSQDRPEDNTSVRLTTLPLNCGVCNTSQNVFGILDHHSKKRSDPHPKYSPGPPRHIAVETPAIFPVPITAQRAVQKVRNCDRAPASFMMRPSSFIIPKVFFHQCLQ